VAAAAVAAVAARDQEAKDGLHSNLQIYVSITIRASPPNVRLAARMQVRDQIVLTLTTCPHTHVLLMFTTQGGLAARAVLVL
tara:strand:- start:91 stop:336 length:246 start_codon:yes stop_codon:yes gene_type:complete